MNDFRIASLIYSSASKFGYFGTLEEAVTYHKKLCSMNEYYDLPIGIWHEDDLVAIGYKFAIYYKKDE